jgi:hypothetical protein
MQLLSLNFGQMHADIDVIMNHIGIADKKHKSHNDLKKHGKAQASLTNIKRSKRLVKASVTTSFLKHYVDQEDSAASNSDDQDRVEHAMFAQVKIAPRPSLLFNRFMNKISAQTCQW